MKYSSLKSNKGEYIEAPILIQPDIFKDERGFFLETFRESFLREIGIPKLVQHNQSRSKYGVLRGLHYQIKHPQGKLVRCTQGEIFDAIVDLRVNSPTYKKNFTFKLNRPDLMLWVPPGLAHGFFTISDTAEFEYKVTDYFYPQYDRTLKWNDKEAAIAWPFYEYWGYPQPKLSAKDERGLSFDDCQKYDII